jgi:hypothetical protein
VIEYGGRRGTEEFVEQLECVAEAQVARGTAAVARLQLFDELLPHGRAGAPRASAA